jgi:hypothetical protein
MGSDTVSLGVSFFCHLIYSEMAVQSAVTLQLFPKELTFWSQLSWFVPQRRQYEVYEYSVQHEERSHNSKWQDVATKLHKHNAVGQTLSFVT